MAFPAGGDGFVLGGMALGAEDIPVFGPAGRELCKDIGMTGAAVLRRGVWWETYLQRHVWFVAMLAGFIGHSIQMGCMAVETWRAIAVSGVAGGTVQGGVYRAVLLELLELPIVAGGALRGYRSAQGDLQGGVGIGVALQAVVEPEMRDPFVTAVT